MVNTPALAIHDLFKSYGPVEVLKDISLSIDEGDFLVLVGPSGCGKSTTLRLLAGLELPDEGKILIDGKDVTTSAASDRNLSMVFQSYALFPHLTVQDNIAFGLRRESRDSNFISERVSEMLKLTRLEKFARRKPHQISGGQRQRVALAR